MIIVLINRNVETLSFKNENVKIGRRLSDYFSRNVEEKIAGVLTTYTCDTLTGYRISETMYDLNFAPLSGRFRGKGVVMTLTTS